MANKNINEAKSPLLHSFVVSRGNFKDKDDFVSFCTRNKINGQHFMLWGLFTFEYAIRLYRPFTTEPVKWEEKQDVQ